MSEPLRVPFMDEYEADADDVIRESLRQLGLSDVEIDRASDDAGLVLAAYRELWREWRRQPQVKEIAERVNLHPQAVHRINARLLRDGLMLNPGKARWIPAPQ